MTSIHPQYKRVLTIDGGGFRGLGCLLVIDSIMKAVSSRARKQLLPCEVFDLVSGTSTGGIIAILLGRLGLDCQTAINVYKELTTAVCGSDEPTFYKAFFSSIEVGLDSKPYEATIANVVGKYAGHEDMTMAQDGVNLIDHKHTKTFVTVTSDTPIYNNRVHCIPSYPARYRTPPVGHEWLIREVMRGTVASPLFLSPLLVSKYGFRDSGFSGFNNPTELARQEFDELWPNEKPGVVISIGTDFSSLAPQQPRREWAVTNEYAQLYVKQILDKLPSSDHISEGMRKDALNVVRQLVMLAVDTEIIHSEASSNLPHDVYIRLNPPLELANTDLVDIFHADQVERTVTAWLRGNGQKYIADIASHLVELNEEPLTIDQARYAAPPPPPPSTNPGYNVQLDEPRPDTMTGYLNNYHVFLVIDDSGSMQQDNRWPETRDALLGIAEHALQQGSSQIDMRFLNSPLMYRGIKGADTIRSIFDQVQPRGRTPTGATLEKVLNDHMTKLDATVGTPEYYNLKPLDIVVLTDGVPTDEPKKVLVEAVARMKAADHHPNSVAVQIIQIGNDDGAMEALKDLMHGDVGSMVDTTPYDGVLTAKKLERILLGGLQPTVRAMVTV